MNTSITFFSELTGLKARLKATWMSGDFDKIARVIAAGGAEFISRLQLRPGARLLDERMVRHPEANRLVQCQDIARGPRRCRGLAGRRESGFGRLGGRRVGGRWGEDAGSADEERGGYPPQSR